MKRPVVAGILIVGLGIGLHLAFRGLECNLLQIFPQLSREIPKVAEAPLPPEAVVEETTPRRLPAKIVVKRAGIVAFDAHPWGRTTPLVRSNSIPMLPSLEESADWDATFPIPAEIVAPVEFWKRIYSYYDTNQVVIHDSRYLDRQYAVLDFHTLASDPTKSDAEKRAIREKETNDEVERIQATLDDPEERERVRAQVGLKDKFLEGLQRSGRYLPIFEEIFEGYGLPRRLSRLSFVESLFKEKSISKVGAAGLWQFMPSTGRRYLTVNRLVDERYDPILATHAAAKLLKGNFEQLGNWPLAINAYNTGAGQLQRAVNLLGTTDIGKIIWHYDNPDYAFASRNFYPEFLAALELVDHEERYFGKIPKDPPMQFDLVELPVTLSFPEISQLSGVPIEQLEELHPAFAPPVFQGKYALPAGSEIRLPRGAYDHFTVQFVSKFAVESLPPSVERASYEERP